MIVMWILRNSQQVKIGSMQKKMESSKATACHIKHMASDLQAVQINLMRHQHTEISTGKHQKRKSFVKPKQPSHKNFFHENSQGSSYSRKSFDPRNVHKNKDRCSKCGDSTHVEGFQCCAKKFQGKACHTFEHFTSPCYQKKQASFKPRRPKTHQLQSRTVYVQERAICSHFEGYSSCDDSSACRSNCSTHKLV